MSDIQDVEDRVAAEALCEQRNPTPVRPMRRCRRRATHGAYCYQHAKKLTGLYAPDKNPPGEPPVDCAEYVEVRRVYPVGR